MTHTCDLVERHRITIPVGATGDNVAVARLHAEAWAEWNGLEIRPESFEVLASSSFDADHGEYLGVAFDVVIGKGDIDTDHRGRGAADAWTWSARFQHWRNVFNGMGRQGRLIARREDGLASVTRIGDPTRAPGSLREALGVPPSGDTGIKIQRGGVRFPAEDIHPAWTDPDHPVSRELRETYAPSVPPVGPPLTDAADQRPPWLRRADGWDEDDAGEGVPPGLVT
ncbi:hypothetical protein Jolie1_067 [Mycobacterium phage Julie1]|uniref:Uncharacterized protein n=1 Tax=Mycobacterium phage Julie1 TaxID=1463812 RepID=W8EB80_9CAUD|nr:hypothetical protein CG90_gp67 [Mycobacterium phage Julie1]YP_009032291.1 hypothetical protein FH38_gp65 [Mycobacterium phage Hosp]AHJ88567.1 hypothetical protein Jolie1_067 [Mycobacterium phage Julie1]AHK12019.1 hypothetical protein Hosp_065 [Mycobacterium phage Hosp]